jgi:hypothetical protein
VPDPTSTPPIVALTAKVPAVVEVSVISATPEALLATVVAEGVGNCWVLMLCK